MNACPNCGGRDFRIDVLFSGTVCIQLGENDTDDFTVTDSDPRDSEWTGDSHVECRDCDWTGTMKEIDPPYETQPPIMFQMPPTSVKPWGVD